MGTSLTVRDPCESNNINAFTRAILLGLVFSGLLMPLTGFGGVVLVVLVLVMMYGRWLFASVNPETRVVEVPSKDPPIQEGFLAGLRPVNPQDAASIVTSPGVAIKQTPPTARNPFMNVLLDEITYNPTRPSAESIVDPNNQQVLEDFFRIQWNSDPTDVFGRTQGQRQFYTMPSTSIPNDQGSFQNWLYLIPGKTCKEGGRDACYPGTNGGPVTWLNKPN
jgi:hypothetical protein